MNVLGSHELAVGVVGFGRHARRSHIRHMLETERVSIAAVCDPSVEARRRAAGLVAAVYEDLEEMLVEVHLDALVVCSPDRYHADALSRGIAAGKHVLVDKPIADRSAQLPLVTDALARARREGLVVASCYPRRFDPPFLWLRDELAKLRMKLGRPLEVRFDFFYRRPLNSGLHRGLLIDHVSHEIDLVHFLFGYSPFVAHRLADDQVHYAVAGSRQDGLCFTFFGSRHLERVGFPELMRVRFERGEVEIDAESGLAAVRDLDSGTTVTATCGATDYERRFRAVNRNFVAAALGESVPYLSVSELLVNTEIGIALTENGRYDSKSVICAAALPPP